MHIIPVKEHICLIAKWFLDRHQCFPCNKTKSYLSIQESKRPCIRLFLSSHFYQAIKFIKSQTKQIFKTKLLGFFLTKFILFQSQAQNETETSIHFTAKITIFKEPSWSKMWKNQLLFIYQGYKWQILIKYKKSANLIHTKDNNILLRT